MDEPHCRKMPPDRSKDDNVEMINAKKSKKEIKEDSIMSDRMIDAEGCHDHNDTDNSIQPRVSYRDSLLGCKGQDFNGVAYGNTEMEDDPLLSDLVEHEWQLPEPTDEIKKLMEIYPALQDNTEDFNEGCRPWNTALIITVLGIKINFYRLRQHLGKIWGFNDFELIDLPNNYYVVRFNNDATWGYKYKKVLFEGPWIIAQHSILVQRWSPYFDPYHNSLGRIATWIRIPNIPLQYYTKKYMWRLGNLIGKTLKVDLHTIADIEDERAKVTRGRFARICVEIDLQKKLVPRVICASALLNVEYEGITLICFACGKYGHRKDNCPSSTVMTADSAYVAPTVASSSTSANTPSAAAGISAHHPKSFPRLSPEDTLPAESDKFGPWMLVNRTKKARIPKSDNGKDRLVDSRHDLKTGRRGSRSTHQSRFETLANLREEEDDIAGSRGMATSDHIYEQDTNGEIVLYDLNGDGEKSKYGEAGTAAKAAEHGVKITENCVGQRATSTKVQGKGKSVMGLHKPMAQIYKQKENRLNKRDQTNKNQTGQTGPLVVSQRTHHVVYGDLKSNKSTTIIKPMENAQQPHCTEHAKEGANNCEGMDCVTDERKALVATDHFVQKLIPRPSQHTKEETGCKSLPTEKEQINATKLEGKSPDL